MKRAVRGCFLAGCLMLMSACGTRALMASKLVSESSLTQTIVIGKTTRAQVLAALGPTTALAFDSGYEVWLYKIPAGVATWPFSNKTGQRDTEFVILFDRNGVVKKTRRRQPPVASKP